MRVDDIITGQCNSKPPQTHRNRVEVLIDRGKTPCTLCELNRDPIDFEASFSPGKDHQNAFMAKPSLRPTEIDDVTLCASDSLQVVNRINVAKEARKNVENSHIRTFARSNFLRSDLRRRTNSYRG